MVNAIPRAVDTVRRRYHGHQWIPINSGMSGAAVWRLDGRPVYYAKVCTTPTGVAELVGEADRIGWLAGQGIPAAEVVEAGVLDGAAWLVTTAVPGRTAAEPWPAHRRPAVVDALAELAAVLHGLPPVGCPFDRTLAVTVPVARRAVCEGRVDLADLDSERRGWGTERLLTALDATLPQTEDLVVCHGDLCLPNVLLDPDTVAVTGLVDLGRLGVADRHADLALATRSMSDLTLNPQYGPAYADRFLRRYRVGVPDVDVDSARIDFYRLLDEFF